MIKTIVFFLASCLAAFAGVLLPADQPFTIAWDNPNPPELVLSFELFSGTNQVAIFTPSLVTLIGVTNGVTSMSAAAPPLPIGTNTLTLVAVNVLGMRSDPSPALVIDALGKPLAPQAIRKP